MFIVTHTGLKVKKKQGFVAFFMKKTAVFIKFMEAFIKNQKRKCLFGAVSARMVQQNEDALFHIDAV